LILIVTEKLGRAVAQAVSRRPLATEAVGFVMHKVALVHSFRVRFFYVNIIAPLLHIHPCII